jgi:hypothetical protein
MPVWLSVKLRKRAAAVRIGGDRLAVAEDHDGEESHDEQRQRGEVADGGHAQHRDEDVEDLLGGERAGRHGVRREDREADLLRESLVLRRARLEGPTHQQPLEGRVRRRHGGDATSRVGDVLRGLERREATLDRRPVWT